MRIDEFQSSMYKYGGLSRPSLFMVEILNARSEFVEDRDIRMFCKNAAIPTMSLNTQAHKPMTIGPEISMPTSMSLEPLNLVFMLDSNHRVLSYFHNWFQKIVNFDTSNGFNSSVDDMYPYEINYKDDYCVTIVIKFFDPQNTNIYEVILKDAYPTSVGQVSLSWEENDTYASLPVSFSYSEISFSSTVFGSPTEEFSRSNGIIERIGQLASQTQTITQSSLPRDIQSAIDKFTYLRNTFNYVKTIL